jgi:tetratricopeptide (TPR) repeat protein
MRLNVITDQRPRLVRPLIERAKQLAPESAEPYKYSAMYNVNSVFQYRTALEETERYIELRPTDPFGYDMKGFMLYRLGKYTDSIDALERAVELEPDDGYAYALMARDYVMLARKATLLTRRHYREKALEMRQKALDVRVPDVRRLAWLERWLRRMLPKESDEG